LNTTGTTAQDALDAQVTELTTGLDTAYMLLSAFLVFLMQAGFAMLCAGSVRSKNVKNILIKNVLDACVGCMAFYFFGWGVAYGVDADGKGNDFIGAGSFFLADNTTAGGGAFTNWKGFIFQWAFAAAAATITSGAMAERTQFAAYLGYSFLLTAFVYPVVVHWVWDGNGWLSAWGETNKQAVIDFAGSGVVHMTGGVAGLMGAMIVGPRTGRFGADGKPNPMPGHNAALVVLGTFILWVGWYGFNPGSQLAIAGVTNAEVTSRVAVITTLAAAAGGVTAMILHYALYGVWDLIAVCNGVLGGLVSITAGCPVIEPYAAVLAGIGGAVVVWATGKLLLKLKIDDPLEAFAVHGACGAFAVIFVGLFATEEYVLQAYGTPWGKVEYGLFLGGSGALLGNQILEVVVITLWVSVTLGGFFFAMKQAGLLRSSAEEEALGLDESKHGGSAYNMEKL
jgi:Amt family ammonium transporter